MQTTSRKKPPFGIGQMGKSFRNEITPGNFIFRTREFEQMEMEYFVEPGTDEELHQYWIDERTSWYVDLGIARDNLRHYEHPKEKLSHYSKRTVDIEYRFGFTGQEWGELEGIANRTDFDLTTHSNHSGVDLSFYDQASGTRYRPYVIEPAAGVGRSMMAFLVEAYTEDEAPNAKGGVDTRVVLRLDRRLAPVKAAVLPLSRNADLSPKARDLAAAAAQALERRVRRRGRDRAPLPSPGRDRHAVLRHGRLRHPHRPGRHDPRARLDGAGARRARPGGGLPRGAPARLLSRLRLRTDLSSDGSAEEVVGLLLDWRELAGLARFSGALALVGRRFARRVRSRPSWSHHRNASGRAARCALRYGEGRVGQLPMGGRVARCSPCLPDPPTSTPGAERGTGPVVTPLR